MLHIDSKLAFRQIPHMSLGCQYFVITSQKFFDCLYLGRRLDNNQILSH